MSVVSPFEAAAADYDDTFSSTTLGRRYRAAVDTSLRWAFPAGSQVLELNCGTGEDAVALARRGVRVDATDAADAMVAATAAKVRAAGLDAVVSVAPLRLESLDAVAGRAYDGVLSNFGGLNCVADLAGAAQGMAAAVRPGGRGVVCVMGPVVPWEWAWFGLHGRPASAVRRLRRDVEWRGMPLRYPSVGSAARAFGAAGFDVRGRRAVGVLLPPPYTERWAARHPHLIGSLDAAERHIERWPGAAGLADHYVLELVRR